MQLLAPGGKIVGTGNRRKEPSSLSTYETHQTWKKIQQSEDFFKFGFLGCVALCLRTKSDMCRYARIIAVPLVPIPVPANPAVFGVGQFLRHRHFRSSPDLSIRVRANRHKVRLRYSASDGQ